MTLTQICQKALESDSRDLHRVATAIGLVCVSQLAEGNDISIENVEGDVMLLLAENEDDEIDEEIETVHGERGPPVEKGSRSTNNFSEVNYYEEKVFFQVI